MIKRTRKPDRYHGFAPSRLPAPAEAASPRLATSPTHAMLSAPDGGQGKFPSSQGLENTRNGAIFIPTHVGEEGYTRWMISPARE